MYRFADLFSEDDRRAVAALSYERDYFANDDLPAPRYTDDAGYTICPIGRLLQAYEERDYPVNQIIATPTAPVALQHMRNIGIQPRRGDTLSVKAFIVAWDMGKIVDLAEALGVKEPLNVDV